MRNLFILIIIVAAFQACSSKAGNKADPLNADIIPVRMVPVNTDTSLNTITASGLVSTEGEARLSFKIGGIIDGITVREGEFVRRGQLLASIKSTEIGAQVQQVQLSVQKAERDYQRAYNLYKDSVATLEQLQNAKTGLEIARQGLSQVSFNQQYAKIYAPADGFIVKKIGNVGELASPGSPIIFMNAVNGSSKWILKLGLSDKDWAAVQTGNKASISLDAFPEKTFNGTVSKKSLAADPVSGTFGIEVQVDFGALQPAVGMFGSATITASGPAVGFSIPYEALLEASGKKGYVFVSNDQKKVKKVEVSIAGISNNTVYITDGLQGYVYVISSGSPYLTEQSSIRVQQ